MRNLTRALTAAAVVAAAASCLAATPTSSVSAAVMPGRNGPAYFTSYLDGVRIWRMRADGTHARPITTAYGEDHSPEVSPDGRSIVFQSSDEGGWHLFKVRADGSELKRLTTQGDDAAPSWSPDGRHILFTRYRDRDPRFTPCAPTGRTSTPSGSTPMDSSLRTHGTDGESSLFEPSRTARTGRRRSSSWTRMEATSAN